MEGNNEVAVDARPKAFDYLGSEDSFTFSWGFNRLWTGPHAGITHLTTKGDHSRLSIYRFHDHMPIRFDRELVWTIDWRNERRRLRPMEGLGGLRHGLLLVSGPARWLPARAAPAGDRALCRNHPRPSTERCEIKVLARDCAEIRDAGNLRWLSTRDEARGDDVFAVDSVAFDHAPTGRFQSGMNVLGPGFGLVHSSTLRFNRRLFIKRHAHLYHCKRWSPGPSAGCRLTVGLAGISA